MHSLRVFLSLSLSFLLMAVSACKREAAPPPPLAAEQIVPSLDKTFLAAKPEAKELVGQIKAALEKKDYATAYTVVQTLCASPGLTDEQRLLASRAMLTITSLVQTAQAQGDTAAGAALDVYKSTK